MLRNAFLALILAAGVAFVMIVGGEVMVRLVGGPPAHFLYSGSFRDVQSDWDIVYGVDESSHRSTCRDTTADPDARRIAVIGDSFVFGQGVEDCEVFVSLLDMRSEETTFENFGVVGSGIAAYIVVARDLVDESFDGALVLFYGNDLSSLGRGRSAFGRLADRFSLMALARKVKHSVQVRGLLDEQEGLAAGDAARVRRQEWTFEGKHNNTVAGLRKDPRVLRRAVDPGADHETLFAERFAVLADELTSHLAPDQVFIAMVPEGHTVSHRLRAFVVSQEGETAPFGQRGPAYERVRRLAAAQGFHFIDLFDAYHQRGDESYHPHDLHWTPAGHRIMSELAGEALGVPARRAADTPDR
jgi:hypothetical protein